MTLDLHQPAPARRRWAEVIGWAAYLGCSWTWCIGMFLPVLLARDFGLWGLVAFAAPNILGAAAMGFVLGSPPGRAWLILHSGAITWFMRITLIFQWFFLGWLAASLGNSWWLGLGVLLVGSLWPQPESRGWRAISLLVWLGSLACAAVFLRNTVDPPASLLHRTPGLGSAQALWLAPVCIFGFALCPYLDATFHHARRQLNAGESRVAFAIGFGFFFAAMLVFTLLYTPLLIDRNLGALSSRTAAAIAVAIHMTLQIGFTTFAFYDAFDRLKPRPTAGFARLDLAVLILVAYVTGMALTGRDLLGREAPELVYRAFMAFYGLVFPAYVWVCIIPGRRASAAPRRTRLAIFWTAVVLAAPCYWLGFIEQRTFWLAPGLAIILGARLLFLMPRFERDQADYDSEAATRAGFFTLSKPM